MKKSILTLFISVGCLLINAQVKIFESNITSSYKHSLVVKNINDSDFIVILSNSSTGMPVAILDQSGKEIKITVTNILEERRDFNTSTLLLSYVEKNKMISSFVNKKSTNLLFTKTDLISGVMELFDSIPISEKESIIDCSIDSGSFYLITQQINTLHLFRRDCSGKKTDFRKQIDITYFGKFLNGGQRVKIKNIDNLLNLPFVTIENNLPYPFSYTQVRSKFYHLNGEIAISIDNDEGETHLLLISKRNLDYSENHYPPAQYGDEMSKTGSNSYIIDSSLVKVTATKETGHNYYRLGVVFYNLHTGQFIKRLDYTTKDSTSFFNGDIEKIGNFWHADIIKKRKSVVFVSDLANNNPSLCIFKISQDQWALRIGTLYARPTFLGFVLSAAISGIAGYSFIARPGVYPLFNLADKSNSNTISGTLIVNSKSYQVEKQSVMDSYKRIENYQKTLTGASDNYIFFYQNNYCYSYYDKESKKYFVYKF
jgi:hypothetical protein